MAEATLERLKPELGDVRVIFALGRFDQLRADESAEINRVRHFVDSSKGLAELRLGIALPRPSCAASSNGDEGSDQLSGGHPLRAQRAEDLL
jgi:hypothetical protein